MADPATHAEPPSPPARHGPGDRVAVLLPLPLAGAYDYGVGPDMVLQTGDLVRVPLGPRQAVGVVWGPGTGEVAADRLKPVAERCDLPPLAPTLLRFVDWVAAYTLSAPGAVLRMVLSAPDALSPERRAIGFGPVEALPEGLRPTPARQRVLDA
ncbi:MAG: hypothetical protein KDE22_12145, partial [Rhodobacterales bacterium]|nr:hypothetical protein [Rhodobacterales bacterium]